MHKWMLLSLITFVLAACGTEPASPSPSPAPSPSARVNGFISNVSKNPQLEVTLENTSDTAISGTLRASCTEAGPSMPTRFEGAFKEIAPQTEATVSMRYLEGPLSVSKDASCTFSGEANGQPLNVSQ
ncbi:hypothetical protein HNR42_002759 [Deinobacterium chartae]|uniref:Lipoprotein n=1 Tax=Deinobacterium chartae TaxID=521158 RepID=A0A841I0K4_9DEIO|nr:hypothetical protein [Deinobacterium chartae]MBB6099321.1 hypothetical protein [Deinobacterium chartae]